MTLPDPDTGKELDPVFADIGRRNSGKPEQTGC